MVKQLIRRIGRGAKKIGRGVGRGVKGVARGAQKVGRKVGRGVKGAARGLKSGVTRITRRKRRQNVDQNL